MAVKDAIFWDVEDRARAPSHLTPSSMARAVRCPWSAVKSTSASSLPSGPEAAFGSVLHRLVEVAVRGDLDPRSSPNARAALETTFDALVVRAELEASSQGRGHLVPLQGTIPTGTWLRRKAASLHLAARMLAPNPFGPVLADAASGRPHRSTNDAETTVEEPSARDVPEGRHAEVRLVARGGRVRGRVDVLERTGGHFVVTDFKTGRVHDHDGELLEHVLWQMRTYAELVADAATRTTLVVEGLAGERRWEYDATERTTTLAALKELESHLIEGEETTERLADKLARPGSACVRCDKRRGCPAYLDHAPGWWRDPPEFDVPGDVWGVVDRVDESAHHVDLTVVDPLGTKRRVVALGRDVAPADVGRARGRRIALFGLSVGRARRYLHDLPSTPSRRRAWETLVLLDDGRSRDDAREEVGP